MPPGEIYQKTILGLDEYTTANYQESAKRLEDIKDAYEEYPNVNRWLGNIYLEFEDYDKALEYYNIALTKKNKFEEFPINTERDNYALAFLYHHQGLIYHEKRHFLEAEKNFKKSIDLLEDKNYTGLFQSKPPLAMFLNDLGGLYYNWGKYNEAIEQYDKALKYRPGDRYARFYRALALYQLGDIAGSKENHQALREEIDKEIRDRLDATTRSGDKSEEQGYDAEHAKLCNLELFKSSILNNLGRIEIDEANFKEAEKLLSSAQDILSRNAEWIKKLPRRSLRKERENEAAIKNNIGLAYYYQGQNDDAKKEFDKVILNSEPRDLPGVIIKGSARAYNNLANIYVKSGDKRKAEEYYKASQRIDPRLSEARYNLKLVNESEGQKESWWDWWFKPRATLRSAVGSILILLLLALLISAAIPPNPWISASTTENYSEITEVITVPAGPSHPQVNETTVKMSSTPIVSRIDKSTSNSTTTSWENQTTISYPASTRTNKSTNKENGNLSPEIRLIFAAFVLFILIHPKIKTFSTGNLSFELEPATASRGSAPLQCA